VNQQTQLVLDLLATGATLEEPESQIQNSACRCVQDSLERCQRGSWKTGQHGVAVVQQNVSPVNWFVSEMASYRGIEKEASMRLKTNFWFSGS